MILLDNIQFTRQKLNALFNLGTRYKRFGPEAPPLIRWIFYFLRPTLLGKKWEKVHSETMHQFQREFLNLQRSSLIPPSYWDSEVLTRFEEYLLSNRAWTLDQCIKLYESEGQRERKPEAWEQFYLKRVKA
ncbi:hypothetical protein [Desulfitobacterium sp.]|uniref:hypothetical protein n=1 Tax=Desulfitobacterium sp. TaxID=49981 RepID=UPI002B213C48|nr:hypothetical protein [Desulfitobacterium sp.]MEA4900896.1 hypothetical protein [Desulfitobacterium sp.]